MKINFQDIFNKEKFQQEVAEEITKDFRKNIAAYPADNTNKNRHS